MNRPSVIWAESPFGAKHGTAECARDNTCGLDKTLNRHRKHIWRSALENVCCRIMIV
jgi:hypothetical protein